MTLLAGFKNIYIHSGNRKEHSLENRNFIKELTIFSKFKGKEAETGPRVPWASWSLPSSLLPSPRAKAHLSLSQRDVGPS